MTEPNAVTKEQMLDWLDTATGEYDYATEERTREAIRSLIEPSSPSGNKAEGEKASGQLRAGDFGKAGEPLVTIDGAGNIKRHPTPFPAPLPAEVEEAMKQLGFCVLFEGNEHDYDALAVIRAALTKP